MIVRVKGYDFEINIDSSTENILVIQNARLFRKVVSSLICELNTPDRDILIKSKDTYLSLKKTKVFTDYYLISLNDKSVLTKLYAYLEQKLLLEYDSKLQIDESINTIKSIIDRETCDFEPCLSMVADIGLIDVFKLLGLKFEENRLDILETVYRFMDICFELNLYELYIFVNLSHSFTKDEIKELYKYLKYHEINFLCIEYGIYDKIESEKIYIIDENFL